MDSDIEASIPSDKHVVVWMLLPLRGVQPGLDPVVVVDIACPLIGQLDPDVWIVQHV